MKLSYNNSIGEENESNQTEEGMEHWGGHVTDRKMYGDPRKWVKIGSNECRRWILDEYSDGSCNGT